MQFKCVGCFPNDFHASEQPIESPVLLLRHCAEFLSAYIEKNFEESLEH